MALYHQRETNLSEIQRETRSGSQQNAQFFISQHPVFRHFSSPAQDTPACILHTVGKLRRRATFFVLEATDFVSCRRRHLRSKICPENLFQTSSVFTVSRSRFPASLAAATVLRCHSKLYHSNLGTTTLINSLQTPRNSA
jgi:hypothetical protein